MPAPAHLMLLAAGGGVSAVTPITILGSKLMAWYDGADPQGDGTPPADGTAVNPWVDKTANNRHQAQIGSGPVYKANILNGKGVIRFDGVTGIFGSVSPFIFANGGCEIWFVAKSDESGTGAIISESRHDDNGPAYRIYDSDSINDYVFNFDSTGPTRFNNSQDRSTNDWDLVICTDNGAATGTSNEVVDVDAGTTGAYTRDSITMTLITIGGIRRAVGLEMPFDGDVADILVLSSSASSGERTALAAYFNTKCGKSWTPA